MNLGDVAKVAQNVESAQTEKVLDVLTKRLDRLIGDFSYSVNGLEDGLNRLEPPRELSDAVGKPEASPVNAGGLPELFRLVERLEGLSYRNQKVLEKLNEIV